MDSDGICALEKAVARICDSAGGGHGSSGGARKVSGAACVSGGLEACDGGIWNRRKLGGHQAAIIPASVPPSCARDSLGARHWRAPLNNTAADSTSAMVHGQLPFLPEPGRFLHQTWILPWA